MDIVDERLTALSALEGSLNGGFGNIKDSLTVNKQKINEVDNVGKVMAEYYTQPDYLMKLVKKNQAFK